ncbi:TadE/TadG family type IV pilus assembly protein [Cognatishimia sp. F0-27]|uniref:TadE/TadG family type IV pilus assembly protein n=1 Tax=Cognatishimia sp. F0-27 TaxID=2816855 RepID=UPI001D0C5CCA|nr:hypothetical protein [Cognatishimia sp. F0-27]MCC1491722.1 hypothetical protein [Cognatishimia sp. F0-27]
MLTRVLSPLRRSASRFLRDEEGNLSVEALIWTPLIVTILGATFSLYDAFRYKALNTKAAFTISDAISRETDPLDAQYLDGMVDVLEFLTRSEGPYSIRVTLVRYNDDDDAYETIWTQTRGDFDAMTNVDLEEMRSGLPTLLHNERVIVVETATEYAPPIPVPGLNTEELFYNMAFTRPRFAPNLGWSEG